LGLVARFKSSTKHDVTIHPFPPQNSPSLAKDLIGNIEAQNTNPDLMALPWTSPMVKIEGNNNTLGHGNLSKVKIK
jgi:hypothetical protein